MSIDYTIEEWTAKDSAELDAWISAQPRTPLQYDPKIAELLEPLKRKPKKKAEFGCCKFCERAFRPGRSTLADFPNTVAQASPGICASCWKRMKRGQDPKDTMRKFRRPESCRRCERKLCGRSRTSKDEPDATPHYGKGYCRPCHQKMFARLDKS